MNRPVSAVVSSTPTVDSMMPGRATGRISPSLVSMPPLKRMMLSAMVPMYWACVALSNWMPSPSVPNSIPATRNINKVGIPNRYPVLLISMLPKMSNEPTSSPISNEMCIGARRD